MKKHFYLLCDNYDEALEMVRTVFGDKLLAAGGFAALGEGNGVVSIFPAAAAVCRNDYEGREFMKLSAPLRHDTEAFRENGVRLLEEAEYYPFALLAYIGGFELLIPQFRNALSNVISSELPTFAIMLSENRTEEIRLALGIGDKMTAFADRLRTAVLSDDESVCVDISDEECGELAEEWIREFTV